MSNRKRIEGLLAQAAYEELDAADRAELDRALAESAELREEAAAFGRLAEGIPSERVEVDRDLTSAVLARLHNAPPPEPFWTARWVPAVAALLVVSTGVLTTIWLRSPIAGAPGVAEAPVGALAGPSSLQVALNEARVLMGAREFAKAYVTLAEITEEGAGDSGEARQLMADLAYDELQWYPEAYANYNALRLTFGQTFQATAENLTRLNVLDEARGGNDDYASLHALDAARRGGSFEELEAVLARYPATYVASLAAADLARVSTDNVETTTRLAALRSALRRTEHPIARAQLKVEMAHVYAGELGDPAHARELYEEVAGGDVTQLAGLARTSLERLGTPSR